MKKNIFSSKFIYFIIPALCAAAMLTNDGCAAGSSAGKINGTGISAGAPVESSAGNEHAAANRSTDNEQTAAVTPTDHNDETVAVTVTDMIGREVTVIPGGYRKVVCIGAGALRMYTYVGDVSLLCGVEDIDDLSLDNRPKMFDSVARPYVLAYGKDFEGLGSCGVGGPNAQAAEAEKILSCDPDIVISEYKDVEKENALQEQLGVPVVTLSAGADGVFDDNFRQSLRLLGQIFGAEERAEEIIGFVDAQTREISARTEDIAEDDKPSVYICGLGNWGTTDHLTTSEHFKAFEVAHIKNVLSGTGAPGTQPIEEEKFAAIGDDIDIMIIDSAAIKNILPLYQQDDTLLDTCRAWKDGNAYLQMAYNAYYTNFELSLMNAWYAAKTVYPDRFEDIDMTVKTDEITEVFLGRPLSDEIFSCPSSYGGYQRIDTETFFRQ